MKRDDGEPKEKGREGSWVRIDERTMNGWIDGLMGGLTDGRTANASMTRRKS